MLYSKCLSNILLSYKKKKSTFFYYSNHGDVQNNDTTRDIRSIWSLNSFHIFSRFYYCIRLSNVLSCQQREGKNAKKDVRHSGYSPYYVTLPDRFFFRKPPTVRKICNQNELSCSIPYVSFPSLHAGIQ